MVIVRKARKGKYLNNLEKCHIILTTEHVNMLSTFIHMNEFNMDTDNPNT